MKSFADGWIRALEQLKVIDNFDHNHLILAAHYLFRHLMGLEQEAPHDIYLMPDGNIVFEWQTAGDIIRRIEVQNDGQGQEMISYPDTEPTFKSVEWPMQLTTNLSKSGSGLAVC